MPNDTAPPPPTHPRLKATSAPPSAASLERPQSPPHRRLDRDAKLQSCQPSNFRASRPNDADHTTKTERRKVSAFSGSGNQCSERQFRGARGMPRRGGSIRGRGRAGRGRRLLDLGRAAAAGRPRGRGCCRGGEKREKEMKGVGRRKQKGERREKKGEAGRGKEETGERRVEKRGKDDEDKEEREADNGGAAGGGAQRTFRPPAAPSVGTAAPPRVGRMLTKQLR